jgi:cytochrome P450
MSDIIGLMQEAAGYGDLVTISTKPALAYLVSHPDLVEELFVTNHRSVGRGWLTSSMRYLLGNGLVTADGPLHLRQRRLMQPQFHHRRIAGYAEIMTDFARRHERRWQAGAGIDMAREMSELTLHIVVMALFGLELPDTVRRIGQAFEVGNEYVTSQSNRPLPLRRAAHRLPFSRPPFGSGAGWHTWTRPSMASLPNGGTPAWKATTCCHCSSTRGTRRRPTPRTQ